MRFVECFLLALYLVCALIWYYLATGAALILEMVAAGAAWLADRLRYSTIHSTREEDNP